MEIEMLVAKKYVEVDLKLDTKALSRDGVEANGHCDRINEDPKKHYLLAILKLCGIHSKATYLEDIADCLHLRQTQGQGKCCSEPVIHYI